MSRPHDHQAAKWRQNQRLKALSRPELRTPAGAREPAAGPVSAPLKVIDPATRALIDAALKEKK